MLVKSTIYAFRSTHFDEMLVRSLGGFSVWRIVQSAKNQLLIVVTYVALAYAIFVCCSVSNLEEAPCLHFFR